MQCHTLICPITQAVRTKYLWEHKAHSSLEGNDVSLIRNKSTNNFKEPESNLTNLIGQKWRCLIMFYLGRCGSQVTIEPAWRQQHSQSQGAYTTLSKLILHHPWEIETHKSKMS